MFFTLNTSRKWNNNTMELTKFYDKWFLKRLGGNPSISKKILFNEAMLRVKGFLANSKREGFNVLDVGCGAGHFVERLLKQNNIKVTGIDITKDTLIKCRELYPRADFRQIDFSEPQYVDRNYDIVCAIEVIEHIPYARQHIFIKNCWQSLRKGGVFILTTPNKDRSQQIPVQFRTTQPIEDWLSIRQLSSLLESHFNSVSIGTCIWFFPNRYIDAIFKRLFYPFHMTLEQRFLRNTNLGCHIVATAHRRD